MMRIIRAAAVVIPLSLVAVGHASNADERHPYSLTGAVSILDKAGYYLSLSYTNLGERSQCFRYSDFSGHFSGPLFRIQDGEGGFESYQGVLATVNEQSPLPIIMVHPNETVSVGYSLLDAYQLTRGETYTVSYSMPVADCEWLVLEERRMPGAATLFALSGGMSDSDWEAKKETAKEIFGDWAEGGFWAELARVQLQPSFKN